MTEHREQLESVLDYLINNELQEAEALLHHIIVEKARDIYSVLVEEDETELEFGGDPKEDFADEIEADSDEIDAEEEEDDDEGAEDFDYDADGDTDEHEEDHGEVVDRLEDVEAAIAELTAEFEEVFGDELDSEGGMDDFGGDEMLPGEDEMAPEMDDMGELGGELEMPGMADEEENMFDSVEEAALAEATAFLKDFAMNMKGEGGEVGTGPTISVNKKSTHSTSKRPDHGGSPHPTGKEGDGKNQAESASDETMTDNVGLKPESAPKAVEKPTGEDKSASSPLSPPPSKP